MQTGVANANLAPATELSKPPVILLLQCASTAMLAGAAGSDNAHFCRCSDLCQKLEQQQSSRSALLNAYYEHKLRTHKGPRIALASILLNALNYCCQVCSRLGCCTVIGYGTMSNAVVWRVRKIYGCFVNTATFMYESCVASSS